MTLKSDVKHSAWYERQHLKFEFRPEINTLWTMSPSEKQLKGLQSQGEIGLFPMTKRLILSWLLFEKVQKLQSLCCIFFHTYQQQESHPSPPLSAFYIHSWTERNIAIALKKVFRGRNAWKERTRFASLTKKKKTDVVVRSSLFSSPRVCTVQGRHTNTCVAEAVQVCAN